MNKETNVTLTEENLKSAAPLKIILLHGWGWSSTTWAPILPKLQTLGNVTAIDLPGFGKSPVLDNYSLDSVIDFIAEQLTESCVLVGWSLGGMLAVQIATRYPRKVSHIITLAANIKFVATQDFLTAMPLTNNITFTNNFSAEPLATLKLFSGLIAQGDANERMLLKKIRLSIFTETINDNWLQALNLLSQLNNREFFSDLKQPGLHIFGENDVLVPALAAPALAALNAQQEIIIVPQAAHALHWSNPEKVVQLIKDFLATGQRTSNHETYITLNNASFNNAHPSLKDRIAKSFSRAAHTYDSVASFQRTVGETLLNMISKNIKKEVVLDLGCGTGYFTRYLQEKFPQAAIIGIDIAEGMLSVAKAKNLAVKAWVCGDAEKLPVAALSIDAIFSSLALQWCQNLPELFSELNRVLKPGGTLFFSTLGPDTLHELKNSWHKIDNYVHVNRFKSSADIKTHLLENNFSLCKFDQQLSVLEFEKLTDFTRELKSLGAHNINFGRATGLTGRKKIIALKAAYEHFRRNDMLPASYDVLYIIAEKRSSK